MFAHTPRESCSFEPSFVAGDIYPLAHFKFLFQVTFVCSVDDAGNVDCPSFPAAASSS
jgi:hypothetical protein